MKKRCTGRNIRYTDCLRLWHNRAMNNPDWYPIKLADRIAWHANYSFTAQAAGTNYGLSADDLADIARDAANVPKVVAFKEAAQGFAQAVTEWSELVLHGPPGVPFPPPPPPPGAPTLEPPPAT